jgi:hypothetical protein
MNSDNATTGTPVEPIVRLRERTDTIWPGCKVGRLTVLGHQWRDGKYWRCVCRCDCGKVVCVMTHCIGKSTMSCGCYQREIAAENQKKMVATRTAAGEYRPRTERVAVCQRCNKLYYSRPERNNRYCSYGCRAPGGVRRHTCAQCCIEYRDSRRDSVFCGKACADVAQTTAERRRLICEECGKGFVTKQDHGRWPKFCQRACFEKRVLLAVGDQSCSWQGGRFELSGSGHVMVYQGPRPNRERPEHRLIVEEFLGRSLDAASEPIIHLNGDNADNRIENLFIFASHKAMLAMFSRGEYPERSNLVAID